MFPQSIKDILKKIWGWILKKKLRTHSVSAWKCNVVQYFNKKQETRVYSGDSQL